jgi:cell division protein FtsQ
MWDNAPLLRGIANLLFSFSLVLALYGVTRYVIQQPAFSIRAVELVGVPQHVDITELERVINEKTKGNFFTVDLDSLRLALEQVPRIRKVSLRRKFPWSVQLKLEEHVALARWNDKGSQGQFNIEMVNTHGEVFRAINAEILPAFNGPNESSGQVTAMYAELSGILKPLHQDVLQIALSPRFSWQLRLRNGMTLVLGREQMQARLMRFVSTYPYSLALMTHTVTYLDLRYLDGFAVFIPRGTETRSKKESIKG